jgi:hypothetical protein
LDERNCTVHFIDALHKVRYVRIIDLLVILHDVSVAQLGHFQDVVKDVPLLQLFCDEILSEGLAHAAPQLLL